MPENLQSYLDFTVETAYLAGRLTLGHFQAGVQVDMKADDSPVTVADRSSEQLIRSRIEKNFPAHAILGEEFGESSPQQDSHRWLIDPIDGTKSFIHGVPLYAVLIGLEIEGTIQVGAAYFPALDEMVAAADGLGCWWNGRRAAVSSCTSLDQAVMAFTDVNNMERYGKRSAFERLCRQTYYRAGWGDAYGHLLTATGRVEVMLDPIMHSWDCGPFPVILREAGGYFGDWNGNETIYANEGLSTSRILLQEVLALLDS
ncbi:MAG: inositol monophosphatase family protein [Anaerolineales bacterium]|nr:inositol monophosphatase family protein [Anaerolineales bacterium]